MKSVKTRWRPWFRRFLLTAGLLAAGVALMAAGGLLWLQSASGQRWLQARVNQSIPGSFQWDQLRLSPLAGRLEVSGLQLSDAAGAPLAGFQRLLLELAWRPLLQGTLQIHTLDLAAPWANLQVQPDGGLNLATALMPPRPDDRPPEPESGRGELPIDIAVRRLHLTDGRLAFSSAPDNLSATLAGLTLNAEGRWSTQSATVRLTTGSLEVKRPDLATGLDRLALEAVFEGGDLSPFRLSATAGASRLSAAGKVQNALSAPRVDLRLDLDLRLSEILAALKPAPPVGGRLAGRLTASGEMQNPSLELDLTYEDGRVAGCQIEAARLRAEFEDRLLRLEEVHLAAGAGTLRIEGNADLKKVFPKGVLSSPMAPEAAAYALSIESRGLRLEELCPLPGLPRGRIDADLALTGNSLVRKGLGAEVELRVDARDFAAGTDTALPVTDLSLQAKARLEDDRLTLAGLSASAGNLRIETDGTFDLSSQALSGGFRLRAPDLAPVLASFGQAGAQGSLSIDGGVRGSLKRPTVNFHAEGDGLAFSPIRIGRLGLTAELPPSGVLKVAEISLDNRGSRVRGGGTIGLFDPDQGFDPSLPMDIQLTFEELEPGDFWDRPGTSGRLQGTLQVGGRLGNPRAELLLAGAGVAAENVRIGDLEAALRLEEGRLEVAQLTVRNQRSVLAASGSMRLMEATTGQWLSDPPLQLEVAATPFYVEDFTPLLKGRTDLSAQLSGSLRRPLGSVTLTGKDLDTGYQKLPRLQLNGLLETDGVRLDSLEAGVASGETLTAKGWLGYDQSYAIELESDGIALQHIDLLNQHFPATEGTASLNLKGEGTLAHPRLDGRLAVTGVRISGSPVDDLLLDLGLEDRLATISGRLNFELSGSYHLDTHHFDLRALFRETSIAPYTRIAGLPDLKGRLSGSLVARGTPEQSTDITAEADISGLSLTYRDSVFLRTERLRFSMANGQVRIPRSRLSLLTSGWLEISGQGGVDGPLDFEGAGVVPLQALAPFVEDLDNPTGSVSFQSRIGGTRTAPDLRLELVLNDIGCDLPGLATRLHGLEGNVLLTPDALRVAQLKGMLDTGTFELSGDLALKDFSPLRVNARLNANALPLAVPDTLDVLMNGNLQFSGTPDDANLRGTLTLIEGLYYKDVNLSPLKSLERKPPPAPAAPRTYPYPFLKNLTLDVAVKHRNPFLVDNNLASLEITPDLRIGGSLERPVVDGRIEVPSGTVTYYHRSFTVDKGVVDFVSPYRIEPLVNLESETQVRSWTIRLTVSGPPDNLRFQLTSTPQETDQDILSLLLVGKTSRELIAGEGGSSASPEQLMAQLVAGGLVEEVKKTTGVDLLEVEASGEGSNGEEADTHIKVTVGKELSRRLMVKYATESQGGEVVQRAEAEYRLLEHFLLTAFQDNLGVFGGALSYRLEFR